MQWGSCFKSQNRVHCENNDSPGIYTINRPNAPASSNRKFLKIFWIAASIVCVALVAALISLTIILVLKNKKTSSENGVHFVSAVFVIVVIFLVIDLISSFTHQNHTALPLIFLNVQNFSTSNLDSSTLTYIDYELVTDADRSSKNSGGSARSSPRFRLVPVTLLSELKTTVAGTTGNLSPVNLLPGSYCFNFFAI